MVPTRWSSFCFHLLGTLGLCSDWGGEEKGTGIQKAGVPEPALPLIGKLCDVRQEFESPWGGGQAAGIPSYSFSVKEEVLFHIAVHSPGPDNAKTSKVRLPYLLGRPMP